MFILVTGGAGYISSHTIVELIHGGHNVIAVDNLCNSSKETIKRVEKITGKKIPFYEVDIRDRCKLSEVLQKMPQIGDCTKNCVKEKKTGGQSYGTDQTGTIEDKQRVIGQYACWSENSGGFMG